MLLSLPRPNILRIKETNNTLLGIYMIQQNGESTEAYFFFFLDFRISKEKKKKKKIFSGPNRLP